MSRRLKIKRKHFHIQAYLRLLMLSISGIAAMNKMKKIKKRMFTRKRCEGEFKRDLKLLILYEIIFHVCV